MPQSWLICSLKVCLGLFYVQRKLKGVIVWEEKGNSDFSILNTCETDIFTLRPKCFPFFFFFFTFTLTNAYAKTYRPLGQSRTGNQQIPDPGSETGKYNKAAGLPVTLICLMALLAFLHAAILAHLGSSCSLISIPCKSFLLC